ncbi:MAG: pyruvate dehydrogenase E2 component (dihydrolipoamide acetyltransferase) [Myxococcota bacterium]|jgi:pyruvate dehydrogenase E2 component (dihydrolipoamide acetyltransferase)
MAFVFELPEVGEGVVEAEVAQWHVAVGDVVSQDQPLCEITTDKAQLEISSPRAGRVTQLHGEPGDIIKVHTPLVTFDDAAGAASVSAAPAPAAAAPAPAPAAAAAAPAPAAPSLVAAGPASHPDSRGTTKATPAVRRHARELDLDIHQVPGTGRRGRVTHDDLQGFSASPPASEPLPLVAPALPQVRPSGSEERIAIRGVRRAIAEAMVRSKRTAPHFTYVEEVDCTRLVEMRTLLKKRASAMGVKLTYIPIFMKACSIVMRQFPNVNAVMDEERQELVVKGDHNFGISVDTPNGLYVAVIKNVEQKSILHIAAEMNELVERTRAGKARLDELRGGTFTLTSVGSIGGVLATPILNTPEVAILGVNAIRDRAVVVDGEIVVRKMTYLSPSFDHRVIDGAVAARFVAALKDVLEEPEAMLLELA